MKFPREIQHLVNLWDPCYLSHIIRHPRDAQLSNKQTPLSTRRIPHSILQILSVAFAVGLLDGLHVVRIPVEADHARDEKLTAEPVLARGGDGVVEEEGVSDGLVDHAV